MQLLAYRHQLSRLPHSRPHIRRCVRVDFDIRSFAVADQRTLTTGDHPDRLVAPPCREVLITPSVMSRAAKLKNSLPGAESMLERIAGGIYVEGMESLAPLLVDGLVPMLSLLPPGSLVVVMEPEKVRTRAHDLVATNEEFLLAAWDSASDGQSAPIDISSAEQAVRADDGEGRTLASGSFQTLAEARATALGTGLGWWAVTALNVNAVAGQDVDADTAAEDIALIDSDADTLTVAARDPLGFHGDVEAMLEFLQGRVSDGWRVVAVTEGTVSLVATEETAALGLYGAASASAPA